MKTPLPSTSKELPKSVKNFLGDLIATCHRSNISLRFAAKQRISVGSRILCNGSFSETELVVATGHKLDFWLGILVHESCHMDQFLNKTKIWKEVDPHLNRVEEWITPNTNPRGIKTSFRKVIELELDCERRSLKKIEDYKLPLDVEDYIRGANAYLFAYMMAYKTRKWYKYPYRNPKIRKNMPTEMFSIKDYTNPEHPLLEHFVLPNPFDKCR